MNNWINECKVGSRLEIIQYCVNDFEWQQLRLSLKGTTTHEKMDALHRWLLIKDMSIRSQVQVSNYIGALKRGGQLNAKGEVIK